MQKSTVAAAENNVEALAEAYVADRRYAVGSYAELLKLAFKAGYERGKNMTIPIERAYSLQNTREFLRSLLDPKKTPRIPKWIRTEAYKCLKHYPSDFDIQQIQKKCPEVMGYYVEDKEE